MARKARNDTGLFPILLLQLGAAFLVGRGASLLIDEQSIAARRQAFRSSCSFELMPSQSYLANFYCPGRRCPNRLSDCHCATAHTVKNLVKEYLALGRSGEEIREQVRKQFLAVEIVPGT